MLGGVSPPWPSGLYSHVSIREHVFAVANTVEIRNPKPLTTLMELSQLIVQGQGFIRNLLLWANDVVSRISSTADSTLPEMRVLTLRFVDATRPITQTCIRTMIRAIDGPYRDFASLGLRMWVGAFMLRHGLTTVFLTMRLIRKNVTTVLSIGSGSTRSVSRREAWRLTVPIREVGFMPLYFSQFVLYNIELVGQMMTSVALLVNCATDVEGSFLFRLTTRLWWSILTVGPIRMALSYPIEVFVLLPLTYGIMRYRAVSSLSKSKVTVINTINNYAGGVKERAPAAWDPMHVCHLALEVTGLPWCASVFLVYRNSVLENGLWATWDCLKNDARSWRRGEKLWHSVLRTAFLVLTGPLAFSAALLAGTFRPALAPVIRFSQAASQEVVSTGLPQLPVVPLDAIIAAGARAGLGAEPPSPPKNAMVRIYRLPHDIGLELFAAKATVLIGGEKLPEIAVVTDPRLLVRMPLKPVTNNTFAFDLLYSLGDTALRRSLENLTKVPANPFRNHVEVQKFVTADIDLDWDRVQVGGLTERQFILQGLRLAYALPSGGRVALRRIDPNADIYDYLTPETAKDRKSVV